MTESRHDRERDGAKCDRHSEVHGIPLKTKTNPDDAAKQLAQAGPAARYSSHHQRGDQGPERIRSGHPAAGEGDDPRIPGEEEGEPEKRDQLVTRDSVAPSCARSRKLRERTNR